MATTVLIIVIIALLSNLIILLLPLGKEEKAALCVVVGVVFIVCAVIYNVQTGAIPSDVRERISAAPTLEAKQFLMARFGVTETALNVKSVNELKTPLELAGGVLTVLGLILTWVLVVAVKNSDNKVAQKVHRFAIVLTVAAAMYLLSLYAGLQLTIVPWIKQQRYLKKTAPAAV